MAHNLEISEAGEVAFALRGEPAWHGLANVLFDKDQHVSTADMLKAAHLNDWNVQLEPVILPDGYRTTKDSYMVTRTNPFDSGTDVLAVVGERYKVLQNEQLFDFGDAIVDGGASWESAGSIKDGRVVFGSLVVPKEFVLDPEGANDKTVTYLLVHTSHDGSTAVQANITPVRVVCQNTLNMALNGSKQSFKIRHTATVEGKVQIARDALGITFAHMDKFEELAQQLFAKSVTDKKFNKIITDLYPKPENDNKGSITKWEDKIDLLNDLYFKSITNENIKGNLWGVFNALTERIDYFRAGRKGSQEGVLAAASGFDPVVNAEKNRILTAISAQL